MSINVKLVTPITAKGLRKNEHLDLMTSNDLKVSATGIDIGPNSIECEYEEAMSQPDTILKIVDAENEGCDAAVIDCMGDPGLKGARECVSIPVIGPCETAMHYASMLGHKFTVVTVLDRLIPQFENQALLYGVPSKLACVKAVDIPVLELEDDLNATVEQLKVKSIEAITDHNADVIIFGCTGLFGCAESLQYKLKKSGFDVPVIDPIPLAVNTAYVCAKLKLAQSKKCYPQPPEKGMVGFNKPKLKVVS
ncbi:aspartate/glutamate racemase family protein [Pelagibacterales bacterium SAG-MED31]|nr:aspartate/glutamate racemase family protein [Pelagibacterales bacterium SAG-MED31]